MHGVKAVRRTDSLFTLVPVLALLVLFSPLRGAEFDLPYLLDFYRARHAVRSHDPYVKGIDVSVVCYPDPE